MEFAADAPKPATGGEVTLFVNGEPVGGGRMEHTVPVRFSGYAGMDIGRDNGLPVDRSYADKSPFAFTGNDQEGRLRRQPAPHRGRTSTSCTSTRQLGARRARDHRVGRRRSMSDDHEGRADRGVPHRGPRQAGLRRRA